MPNKSPIPNSFGVKAFCRESIEVETPKQLEQIHASHKNQRLFIVGGGFNIIPPSFFNGTILHSSIKGIDKVSTDKECIIIRVGSGEKWDDLVEYCTKNRYFGLENLSLIPGTVGAAPVQNIGAYGVEVSSLIENVHCYNLENGESAILSNRDCMFGYRTSIFQEKPSLFITAVTFKLYKEQKKAKEAITGNPTSALTQITEAFDLAKLTIQSISIQIRPKPRLRIGFSQLREILSKSIIPATIKRNAVCLIRRKTLHDPAKVGNSGCFFKCPIVSNEEFNILHQQHPDIEWFEDTPNTIKLSACWLIRNAGWAGTVTEGVTVDQRRPVVLLNTGSATGEQVVSVMEGVQSAVFENFKIKIQPEVVLLT